MVNSKENLINQFTQMKSLEQEAHDFYLRIINDPKVNSQEVKNAFTHIAEDEKEHVELVDYIITIIENNL